MAIIPRYEMRTGPDGVQRRMAFYMETNRAYSRAEIQQMIIDGGVGAENTVIGINPSDKAGTQGGLDVLAAGAKLHVYVGTDSTSEKPHDYNNSLGSNIKTMREAPAAIAKFYGNRVYSYELDLPSGGVGDRNYIKDTQRIMDQQGMFARTVLKNPSTELIKSVMNDPELKGKIAPVAIMEAMEETVTNPDGSTKHISNHYSGNGYEKPYVEAARALLKQYGITQVDTSETKYYATKGVHHFNEFGNAPAAIASTQPRTPLRTDYSAALPQQSLWQKHASGPIAPVYQALSQLADRSGLGAMTNKWRINLAPSSAAPTYSGSPDDDNNAPRTTRQIRPSNTG